MYVEVIITLQRKRCIVFRTAGVYAEAYVVVESPFQIYVFKYLYISDIEWSLHQCVDVFYAHPVAQHLVHAYHVAVRVKTYYASQRYAECRLVAFVQNSHTVQVRLTVGYVVLHSIYKVDLAVIIGDSLHTHLYIHYRLRFLVYITAKRLGGYHPRVGYQVCHLSVYYVEVLIRIEA